MSEVYQSVASVVVVVVAVVVVVEVECGVVQRSGVVLV